MNRFILLLCVFVSLKSWAVDPFEDFHEYGQLSEEEIHKIHQGELLYGDTEFGFIVSSGNTNSTSFKLKGNLYQDLENWRNQFKIDTLYKRDEIKSFPASYVVALGNTSLLNFMNSWLAIQRSSGYVDSLYDYWILGENAKPKKARWSVIKDVLHLID